jgi:hypothetical protein
MEEECVHEEIRAHNMREETQHNTYREEIESRENQVSDFLCCCLKMLSDPNTAKKLTHMLIKCIGEEQTIVVISFIPERDVCQVRKQKHTWKEFKMTIGLRNYEMDGVMLNLGSNVNTLLKKSWDSMGKPNLVWSPIQLKLV